MFRLEKSDIFPGRNRRAHKLFLIFSYNFCPPGCKLLNLISSLICRNCGVPISVSPSIPLRQKLRQLSEKVPDNRGAHKGRMKGADELPLALSGMDQRVAQKGCAVALDAQDELGIQE